MTSGLCMDWSRFGLPLILKPGRNRETVTKAITGLGSGTRASCWYWMSQYDRQPRKRELHKILRQCYIYR